MRVVVLDLPDAHPARHGDALPTGVLVKPSVNHARAPASGSFRVTAEDIDEKSLVEIGRDPAKLIAPDLPIRLVRRAGGDEAPAITARASNWGLDAVGATKTRMDGRGVRVAVLDTGIDATHPAFQGITLDQRTCRDFTLPAASPAGGPDTMPGDENGHGTHCAATIFGRDVNGTRIGVAPGVNDVRIGKVIGPAGGTFKAIADGLHWAYAEGAHIVSMSLGIDFQAYPDSLVRAGMPAAEALSQALGDYAACLRLFDRLCELVADRRNLYQGMLVVAAAGNESDRPHYRVATAPPANAFGVMSVGAVGRGDHGIARFSNTRPTLSAPGVDILSAAAGGGLVGMSGTSMAAPHVAGIAALWAQRMVATSHNGTIRADLLAADILGAAASVAGLGVEDVGAGLVQAP